MRRFTKQHDLVLDLFLGSGTTLIEAKRLGRHGIGVELLPEVAQIARRNVDAEVLNEGQVYIDVAVGDSTTLPQRAARSLLLCRRSTRNKPN